MKVAISIVLALPVVLFLQIEKVNVVEIDNSIFKQDRHWRGADGGATIGFDSGKILWLFSDTFIDQDGTGKRSNSKKMIRNSIAVQDSDSLGAALSYYYRGTDQNPMSFFETFGNNWFWTGHGTFLNGKLVIFLMEVSATDTGLGFEVIGWWVAIVYNPSNHPLDWEIRYFKAPYTHGVIVGSSAVLQDEEFIYTFGVKEPATHETYLLRCEKDKLLDGDLSNLQWWTNNTWSEVFEEPKNSSLFVGQTEFSVHYDETLKKYLQIQTYGFGKASIGYRLADQLIGPWSEPELLYTPTLKKGSEFVYTANAHPEFKSDQLIVTYNVNNSDFQQLLSNEEIYFPRIIKLELDHLR